MATWDEVRAPLRLRWQVEQDEPTQLAIVCKVPLPTSEMQQAVGIAPMQVEGVPWLSIAGELFPEPAPSARGALVYADRLPFGAIALRSDHYLLRAGIPLVGLALGELDWY